MKNIVLSLFILGFVASFAAGISFMKHDGAKHLPCFASILASGDCAAVDWIQSFELHFRAALKILTAIPKEILPFSLFLVLSLTLPLFWGEPSRKSYFPFIFFQIWNLSLINLLRWLKMLEKRDPFPLRAFAPSRYSLCSLITSKN